MTRTMYDSTTAGDIPTTAAVVAGYVSGTYAWSLSDWQRFPGAVKVGIATAASVDAGQVLDVETGDATPAQAPAWVTMRRAAGVDPTIYCSASVWPAVRAAFAAAAVAEPHYWIAHYDGDPTIPAGATAKQFADPPASGGHFDLSVVADYWPGVDPAPPAAPQPFIFPPTPDNSEDTVLAPASNDDHVTLVVQGKSRLVIGCGYADKVTITAVDYWGSTASGWNPTPVGVGGHIGAFTLQPNAPLDSPIPAGAVIAVVRYTADHAFTVGAV